MHCQTVSISIDRLKTACLSDDFVSSMMVMLLVPAELLTCLLTSTGEWYVVGMSVCIRSLSPVTYYVPPVRFPSRVSISVHHTVSIA